MRRPSLALTVYWLLVLLLAVGAACYVLATAGQLPCPDGHCPDQGTKEFLGMQRREIEEAPSMAVFFAAVVFGLGGLAAAVFAGLKRLLRYFSMPS